MGNTQTCTKCGKTKQLLDFGRDKYTPTGYKRRCKECLNELFRAWYAANKERVKETNAAYKLAHKEEVNAYNKAYRLNAPEGPVEFDRIRHEKRRSKQVAYDKAQYEANPEKHRAEARASYWKNPEKARLRTKEYRQKNMPTIITHNRNRLARIKMAKGTHTPKDIILIYECQRGLCAYCGVILALLYSVDHMVPLTRGGSNYPYNLCVCCPSCNSSKKDKTSGEFFAYILRKRRTI